MFKVLQHLRPNKDWVIFIAFKKERAVTLCPLLPCLYESYLLNYGRPGTRRSEQIADQPYSGRKVPEYDVEDIRELIEKPYRIIYRIKPDQIDVVAVIHGAQLMPDDI